MGKCAEAMLRAQSPLANKFYRMLLLNDNCRTIDARKKYCFLIKIPQNQVILLFIFIPMQLTHFTRLRKYYQVIPFCALYLEKESILRLKHRS